MKKLLLLLLALVIALFVFAGCDRSQPDNNDPDDNGQQQHEHSFALTNTVEPTCTAVGTYTYSCECGEIKTEQFGEIAEHIFALVSTVDPTCTALGTKSYECSCGEKKTEDFGEKAEHDFELSSSVAPTCAKAGSDEYKCKNCTEIKSETVAATGEHTFELTSTRKATCVKLARNTYTCSVCKEKKYEEFGEYGDHDLAVSKKVDATCTEDGYANYMCWNCSYTSSEVLVAPGHKFGASVEMSRLIPCENDNCSYATFPEGNGKYKNIIVYKFSDDDLARFDSLYAELDAIISAADAYDATLHAYAEDTDLHKAYLAMEAKYEELYDVLEYVVSQYQIAQIEYHMDMRNEEKKAVMDYMTTTRSDLVAQFYSFSEPLYNSMFREYYYYGMSESEIKAFVFESNAVANPEYKALVDSNAQIELEYDALANPKKDEAVLTLYAQFVENNKKIAEIMGYDNYLEYAYENVYDRDYSYQDVQVIADYVKEYISPIFIDTMTNWRKISGYNDQFLNQVQSSFFEVYESNDILNNYIDLLAFESNPDKQITFSDELNSLISEGNVFLGQYEGAYVTYLYEINVPIAYFGPGYDNPFTVAHEFGHYMNEIYNENKYSQSYDLLEMHSQGNEMIYLAYLKNVLNQTALRQTETYTMLNMLNTIVIALAVDTFEQAVYTDYYDGAYSAEIMADNTITYDEYDLLFKSVIEDFGATGYLTEEYWRYVVIHAPCYYVSYSVSALSVLQLYPKANEDFDAAVDSYLKLFTYTDTLEDDGYMDTEAVLEYAGLYGFTDEELYKSIYEYFRPDEE